MTSGFRGHKTNCVPQSHFMVTKFEENRFLVVELWRLGISRVWHQSHEHVFHYFLFKTLILKQYFRSRNLNFANNNSRILAIIRKRFLNEEVLLFISVCELLIVNSTVFKMLTCQAHGCVNKPGRTVLEKYFIIKWKNTGTEMAAQLGSVKKR